MHFRKLRARKMYEMLATMQPYENGNHRIELKGTEFTFYYRGTPIMAYDFRKRERRKLDAGAYEETSSTRAQRRAIHEAIDEFESVIFNEGEEEAWAG